MRKPLSVDQILQLLKAQADSTIVTYKAKKFGITADNSLGVFQKSLNDIAKTIVKTDELALALYDTGIYEARLLCSKVFQVKNLTPELMDRWVSDFENWEICDSFCLALFAKSPFALPKIHEWSKRLAEFENRASFATMAGYCMAAKNEENRTFEELLLLIEEHSHDERTYVKKAVNWALRNIGKRNVDLQKKAIHLSTKLTESSAANARWIGTVALKELNEPDVRMSDYPRSKYRE